MQSGYYSHPPIEFTNCIPPHYDIPYDLNPAEYNMSHSYNETYDKIIEYNCIEPGCTFKHGITLQDYTHGRLNKDEIRYLIHLNTGYRCPHHEPTMARSNVLVQWNIPSGTLFAESVARAAKCKVPILCPEKGCGQTFRTPSEFKRHLAGIFRPFYCLRGNCCIDGVPCRRGFGRIEEVINHLRNENGQHHDAVRYRPVEGWDFRKKSEEEIDEVLTSLRYIPDEDFYSYYAQASYYGAGQ